MSPSEVCALARAAQTVDGLPIDRLCRARCGEERARAGLDSESPIGSLGTGGGREASERGGGGVELSAARCGFDQLRERPHRRVEIERIPACLLSCCERLLIASEAVVEHGGRPLRGRNRDPLSGLAALPDRGSDEL